MSRTHRIPSAFGVLIALALGSFATAAEHLVMQVGTSFDPAAITVESGDTVRWVHSAGNHTITSGTECTYDELYFDESLNAGNPEVEWIVPGNVSGDIPYFCRPHCGLGMVGVISVVEPPCIADLDNGGTVNFADLLLVLGAWGPCEGDCPEDIDMSGAVDFGDILLILAGWGPCP